MAPSAHALRRSRRRTVPGSVNAGSPAGRASSCRCEFCPVCSADCSSPHCRWSFDTGKLQFFAALGHLHDRCAFARYLDPAKESEWVVYAKRPFAGPQQVLDYVGRYTHRVAISNNRLLDIDNGQVRFQWKDYRHHDRENDDLVSRRIHPSLSLHVLPDWFQRIRYYGFLGSRYRQEKLALCRRLLGMPPTVPPPTAERDYRDRFEDLAGCSLRQCPHCRRGEMVRVAILPRFPCASPAVTDSS